MIPTEYSRHPPSFRRDSNGIIWCRLASCAAVLLGFVGCYGPHESGAPHEVVPRLMRLLTDPSPDVRRTAVISLGRIGDPRSGTALLPVLRDSDPRVRQSAAWALGLVGQEASSPVGPALTELLGDPVSIVRMAAAQALGELEEDHSVTELIVTRLQVDDDGIRTAAAYALVGRGRVESLPEVARVLRCAPPSVRKALVAMLGELGGRTAVSLLLERLREDTDAAVRGEAAYRLGIVGDRDSLAVLGERSTRDGDGNVRRWAGWAAETIRSAGVPD